MVRWARLTVLNDNEPGPGFRNDWGWSVLVETDSWVVLFDANTSSGVLEYNVRKLDVDLGRVDFAVLSHHHYDHYGGFEFVGRVKPGLRVYVPPGGTDYLRSWGLEPVVVEGGRMVAKDAWLTGPLEGTGGFIGIVEQAFAFNVDGVGLVVIVGCSHPGADRLVEAASRVSGVKPYMVIGGFHSPPRYVLDRLAEMVEVICPAHCSGEEAKHYVSERYPSKACRVRTGTVLRVDSGGLNVERF